MRHSIAWLFPVLLFVGCAGHVDYFAPTSSASSNNSTIVNKPKESVWNALVPELGKQFFVINNMERSSGFINVSYSGSPEKYVDCGMITSYVKNARGERTYTFPGSVEYQKYEVMENGKLYFIERKMSLEGRINVIFEEFEGEKTKITVNTRYVLTRAQLIQPIGERPVNFTHVANFNSGEAGNFQTGTRQSLTCRANGQLEQDILSMLKK